MNIFYLDTDPAECARCHGDKHVRKMLIEYAQLLCNAHYLHGSWKPGMYKPTHLGNRYTFWTQASHSHYLWLYKLWAGLAEEYQRRFGPAHMSWVKLQHLLAEPPRFDMAHAWIDPPACDALLGWTSLDRVSAYRMLYMGPKRHLAVWTKREAPPWFK